VNVSIICRPCDDQFERVDRVKLAAGQVVLPGDDRNWILGEPLVVDVGDGEVITVPLGFTTDGASIPRAVERLTFWRPCTSPVSTVTMRSR